MSKTLNVSLKVVLVGLMALYPNLAPAGTAKAAAAGSADRLFAKTGTMNGVLTDVSGKPISKATLTVVDGKGKKVASAVTGKDGKFTLANLRPGEYRLNIGDNIPLKLTVADNGTTSNFKIVLPSSGNAWMADMVEGPSDAAAQWTYITIAALTAAIFLPVGYAIGYAVGDDDDGHD